MILPLVLALLAGAGAARATDVPEIRAGSELDFRPYAFTDKDGQPTGFGVELLKTVAGKMGLRVRVTTAPWDNVWNGLVAGELDVLPVVARTPGREPLVDFSLPHTETFDAFFRRAGQPALPDLAAATGLVICVLQSDAAHHQLLERKFAGKVIPVNAIADGMRLVASGAHDAFLCSKVIGTLECGEAGISGLEAGPPIPDYKRVFSFAVRKGNTELLEKLNQGLLIVKTSHEYDKIYERWLGADDPWRNFRRYFYPAVAAIIGLTVLAAALALLLRWQVRRRTRELAQANSEIKAEVIERQKAEAALRELNETLEQRVAQRTIELRASHDRLKKVLEVETVGVMFWDLTTGCLVDANDTFLKMMGYSRGDVEAHDLTWQKFTPLEFHAVSLAEIKKFQATGRVGPYEKEYFRKDGTRQWLLFAGSSLGGDSCVEFCVDISAQKNAVAALKAAKAEAERANKAKDEFLAVLSHELRTPLTSMLGWVKMLQTQDFDQAAAKKGLDVIERNVKTQTHIIEDLLDVSRIIAGKMSVEKQPVDLGAIVAETVTEYQPVAEARKLKLQCQRPETVLVDGDKSRLRQVIWNLLSNATKFTPPGGRIDVALQIENDQVLLGVADTGKGISSDFLPHLFKRFHQEDTGTSRRYMGLGLGLAIVSSIVELHGGSITARSDGEGQGASFTIRLPALKRQRELLEASPGSDILSGRPLRGTRVLLVDDDEDVRDVLAVALKIGGAEVAVASSAREALETWRQFQPAVLVSDIGMPDEDGWVLIQKLRALEQQAGGRPIPAIALTGFAQPDDAARAKAAGFHAHAAKPVEPDVLIQTVARLRNR